ncbi:hypothetical protein HNQ80_003658 [Anaerosolibacter carboniphilus]|uniref:ERF superfamily protein n=1 Tax=Anaerosolibacter carboniphilus TaxID=1417629 RepID=A0A841L5E1_9FIRM|nr:ERF family protein [Anaerosolibacter carboniphilus]MBB6217535.1 hypothetical protein [Anaerosolibacter carboniphilus]
MEDKKNLWQKIHSVMKDVEYLQKDDQIEFGKTKYKAISEEKVTSTVRDSLIKHGLVIIPIDQQHFKDDVLTTVNTKYKIVDIDTGESEIIVSSGTGVDTQDKGVGKAMTYSYKYMLLRTFAIPTGEDPDKISSDEWDEKLNKADGKKGGKAPAGKKNTAPASENGNNSSQGQGNNPGQCSDCSIEIPQAVQSYSMNYYGKPLCKDCQKKHGKIK